VTIPEVPDWKVVQKQVDNAAELFCCRRIGEPKMEALADGAVQELIEAAEAHLRIDLPHVGDPRLEAALAGIRGQK